ncbi:MAG: hypothetical protein R2780_07795 [Crocinitomicaceae bacterium]
MNVSILQRTKYSKVMMEKCLANHLPGPNQTIRQKQNEGDGKVQSPDAVMKNKSHYHFGNIVALDESA